MTYVLSWLIFRTRAGLSSIIQYLSTLVCVFACVWVPVSSCTFLFTCFIQKRWGIVCLDNIFDLLWYIVNKNVRERRCKSQEERSINPPEVSHEQNVYLFNHPRSENKIIGCRYSKKRNPFDQLRANPHNKAEPDFVFSFFFKGSLCSSFFPV